MGSGTTIELKLRTCQVAGVLRGGKNLPWPLLTVAVIFTSLKSAEIKLKKTKTKKKTGIFPTRPTDHSPVFFLS